MQPPNYILYSTHLQQPLSIFENQTNKKNVYVHGGKFSNVLVQILPFIEEWRAEKIELIDHFQPLLKQISSIQFPNLLKLNLFQNKLDSIEGLSRMWMPCLQDLFLANNNIQIITDLRKGNWKKLQKIRIRQNRILQFTSLAEMRSQNLKSLSIEFESKEGQQGCDVSWIAKIQSRLKEISKKLLMKKQIVDVEQSKMR